VGDDEPPEEHTHVDTAPAKAGAVASSTQTDVDGSASSDIMPIVLAPDPLPPGFPVGDYQIECVLGQGGMGAVYRAVQPMIEKRVAIKVLSRQLAESPEAVSRFQKEARAVNQIGHRNIIDVYNFGQLPDGRHYYVMEYVRGETLREVIDKRQGLQVAEAMPIFRDIGRALQAAHAKGIIHRDLKPENVMLAPDEDGMTVKLLDFGVAKLLSGERAGENQTEKGVALGTPKYMSPEQCTGGVVDARADLYAIGVMLFEAVVGRPPFDAPHYFQIFDMHLRANRPVPSIEAYGKHVPPEFDALVRKLMDREPKRRLDSAQELVEELDRITTGLGIAPGLRPQPLPSLPPGGRMSGPPALSGQQPLPVIEPESKIPAAYELSLQAPVLSRLDAAPREQAHSAPRAATPPFPGPLLPSAASPPPMAAAPYLPVPLPGPLLPDPGPLLPIEGPSDVVSLRFAPGPPTPPPTGQTGAMPIDVDALVRPRGRRLPSQDGSPARPSVPPSELGPRSSGARSVPPPGRALPELQRPQASVGGAASGTPRASLPAPAGAVPRPTPRPGIPGGRNVPVATIVVIAIFTTALAAFLLLK
jgi:serine/threonine protein kinase